MSAHVLFSKVIDEFVQVIKRLDSQAGAPIASAPGLSGSVFSSLDSLLFSSVSSGLSSGILSSAAFFISEMII